MHRKISTHVDGGSEDPHRLEPKLISTVDNWTLSMDIDNVEFAKKYVAEDIRQRLLNTAMAQNSRKECTFNTKFAMGGGGVENQLLSLCIQIDQFLALC